MSAWPPEKLFDAVQQRVDRAFAAAASFGVGPDDFKDFWISTVEELLRAQPPPARWEGRDELNRPIGQARVSNLLPKVEALIRRSARSKVPAFSASQRTLAGRLGLGAASAELPASDPRKADEDAKRETLDAKKAARDARRAAAPSGRGRRKPDPPGVRQLRHVMRQLKHTGMVDELPRWPDGAHGPDEALSTIYVLRFSEDLPAEVVERVLAKRGARRRQLATPHAPTDAPESARASWSTP
jgi:hypothetical protein